MAASVRSSRMPPSSGSDFGVRQLANPDRKNPDLARTPLPGAERVKYCYVGGNPVLLPLPPNIWEGWAIMKSLQALTLFACAFLERKAELTESSHDSGATEQRPYPVTSSSSGHTRSTPTLMREGGIPSWRCRRRGRNSGSRDIGSDSPWPSALGPCDCLPQPNRAYHRA